MNQLNATPLTSAAADALSGNMAVPGDKSISHRALMLSSQAIGTTKITGLLEGEDVLSTASALRAMGVHIRQKGDIWEVDGVGVGGFAEPKTVLDMGNSGTSTRLLMGLVSTLPYHFTFSGDASLTKRPMGRITKPLSQMGATFEAREGDKLPLTVKGTDDPLPIRYELPVASAQVKSAILLAGLNCPGKTTAIEPQATRDHTERMLTGMGAEIEVKDLKNGAREITITGHPDLKPCDITVPGDPSSAAFPIVAALIVPDSDITLKHICLNPTRIGLLDTLIEMGGNIEVLNKREEGGEPVGDIRVRYSKLKGITVPAERAPSMIDEYPVLAIAAAFADGTTHMEGVEELRVKESDRLAAVEAGLRANGVAVESGQDWMEVTGSNVKGGGKVLTHLDHRIAMSFLVLGMGAEEPVSVDDSAMIQTSFPGFVSLMNKLGARMA